MDEKEKAEILKSISLQGAILEENQVKQDASIIIGNRVLAVSNILDQSNGPPRIRLNLVKKFELIIAKPAILAGLPQYDIRCCLCGEIVGYPVWYWLKEYSINKFHWFICFNGANKVNASCYNVRVESR